METDAAYWIHRLGLTFHPEGGFFCDMYRSPETVCQQCLPERYASERSFATSIYFLLESGQVSAFHRLRSDELWFYHAGSPLALYVLDPDGTLRQFYLGKESDNKVYPQLLIEQGRWFGAKVMWEHSYALVSCVVAPGFDFDDFELATRGQLLDDYPQHKEIIEQLTPE